MMAGVFAGCKDIHTGDRQTAEPTAVTCRTLDMDVEPTRVNYEKLAEALEARYQQDPEDTATALLYAEKQLQLGNLAQSQEVLAPMLVGEAPEPQAIYLSARIAYLQGDYSKAESSMKHC